MTYVGFSSKCVHEHWHVRNNFSRFLKMGYAHRKNHESRKSSNQHFEKSEEDPECIKARPYKNIWTLYTISFRIRFTCLCRHQHKKIVRNSNESGKDVTESSVVSTAHAIFLSPWVQDDKSMQWGLLKKWWKVTIFLIHSYLILWRGLVIFTSNI